MRTGSPTDTVHFGGNGRAIDGPEKREDTTPSDDERPTGVRERLTAGRPGRSEDGEKSARRDEHSSTSNSAAYNPFFSRSSSVSLAENAHEINCALRRRACPSSTDPHGSPNNNNTVARLIKYAKNAYLSCVPSFYEVKPI